MNDFMNGINGMTALIIGFSFLALILLMGLLTSLYRKAGPNEAIIVYGFRGTRVVKGHGTVIFPRSEEHTSELQSLRHLVCRLLLEKKRHDPPGSFDASVKWYVSARSYHTPQT